MRGDQIVPEEMRARTIYQIVIGIPDEFSDDKAVRAFIDETDRELTRLTGGLLRTSALGTWTIDAQKDDFSGPIEYDQAVAYHLSFRPEDEESIYADLRVRIADAVHRYEIPVEYIHVSRLASEERIFRISEVSSTDTAIVAAE